MKRIILLDDDPTNAGLIKMLLEMEQFDVTICATITKARQQLENEVDAVIADCHLASGVSGLDLVRDIRAGETPAPVTLPIMTTSGDFRMAEASSKAGADRFLLKPFPPLDLSTHLKEVFSEATTHGESEST